MGRSGVTVNLKKVSSASPNVSVSRTSGSSLTSKGSSATPVKGLNLNALKAKITAFVPLATTKLDELNSEKSKSLTEIGKQMDLLLGTASYDEVTDHIEKMYKDYLPEADTVCAFLRGCGCDEIRDYNDEPGCSPHCAGNISRNSSQKQCSQHVIVLRKDGIDLRTNIKYGVTDKAIIYCDESFQSLDEKTINELKSLGINFVTLTIHDGKGTYKTIMSNTALSTMMSKSKSFASQSNQSKKSVSAEVSHSKSGKNAQSQSQKSKSGKDWDYASVGSSSDSSSSNEGKQHEKKSGSSWSWIFIILAILLVIIVLVAAVWLMSSGSSSLLSSSNLNTTGGDPPVEVSVKEITKTEEINIAAKHYGPGVSLG